VFLNPKPSFQVEINAKEKRVIFPWVFHGIFDAADLGNEKGNPKLQSPFCGFGEEREV
jgi:hypothetical protein